MSDREDVAMRFEKAAALFRASGAADARLAGSGPLVSGVSAPGPFHLLLASEACWGDVIEPIRHGAPLIGALPRADLGSPIDEGAISTSSGAMPGTTTPPSCVR